MNEKSYTPTNKKKYSNYDKLIIITIQDKLSKVASLFYSMLKLFPHFSIDFFLKKK
jgi:hypothetical protein